ncbi:hypothetical protein B7494_g3830 [Chlorociboria aeruginascens]|nr:hypothetical protein B7494_g3830 [Chlorociboria aeruginascens]
MAPSRAGSPAQNGAVEGGLKIGFSLKNGQKPAAKIQKPASSLGKRSRGDFREEDDSEGERDINGRVEVVKGFADGGVIREGDERRREKEELVIPRLGNKDWKGEIRGRRGLNGNVNRRAGKGKNLLPPEVQAERRRRRGGGEEEVENTAEGEVKWGLNVVDRTMEQEVEPGGNNATENKEIKVEQAQEAKKEQTDDDRALDALMGLDTRPKGPDLVIPISSNLTNGISNSIINEADAYRLAIAAAPDVSTLEDYERVPVEEFGAALLRGMGWKGEGKESNTVERRKEVKRRQNLLGLGAKELKDAEELGAWVQKSDVKRLKPMGSGHKGGHRDRREGKKGMDEYRREKERREERRRDDGRDERRERDRRW